MFIKFENMEAADVNRDKMIFRSKATLSKKILKSKTFFLP